MLVSFGVHGIFLVSVVSFGVPGCVWLVRVPRFGGHELGEGEETPPEDENNNRNFPRGIP